MSIYLKVEVAPCFDGSGRKQFVVHIGSQRLWGGAMRWTRDSADKLMVVGVLWYPTGYDTIIKRKYVLGYRYFSVPLVPMISVPIFVLGTAMCVLA